MLVQAVAGQSALQRLLIQNNVVLIAVRGRLYRRLPRGKDLLNLLLQDRLEARAAGLRLLLSQRDHLGVPGLSGALTGENVMQMTHTVRGVLSLPHPASHGLHIARWPEDVALHLHLLTAGTAVHGVFGARAWGKEIPPGVIYGHPVLLLG